MGTHVVLKAYVGVFVESGTTNVKVTECPEIADQHNLLIGGTLYYSTHPEERFGVLRVKTSRRKHAELALVNTRLADGFGVYPLEFFHGLSNKAEVVRYLQQLLQNAAYEG